MTSSVIALDLYLVKLEPVRRSRLRRVGVAALDLWCAMSGGLLELSSVGDVVVRRRTDDVEVLRMASGPPEQAAQTLNYVLEQLRELTPADFRSAWGVPE